MKQSLCDPKWFSTSLIEDYTNILKCLCERELMWFKCARVGNDIKKKNTVTMTVKKCHENIKNPNELTQTLAFDYIYSLKRLDC